jgi:hypothetical protein
VSDALNNPNPWHEHQLAFIRWLALPRAERQPKTQKALAAQFGYSEQTLCEWKNLPGFRDAVNVVARELVKDAVPDVLATVRREAIKGSVAHINMVLSMAGLAGDIEAAGKGPAQGVVIREVIVERPGGDS